MSLCTFTGKTEVHAPVERVFQFFMDTNQVFQLSPPRLRFQILQRTSRRLAQGVSLDGRLRIFRIPVRLKILVSSFSVNRHVACLWRQGLFSSWEHDLYFEAVPGGRTRVTHCVLYRPPLGFIGKFLDRVWFRGWLRRTFNHQEKALRALMEAPPPPDPHALPAPFVALRPPTRP